MALNLKKLLQESFAQANPFDGGRTAATVRAGYTKAPPAQTRNTGGFSVGVANPQQRIATNAPAPVLPKINVQVPTQTPAIRVGNTQISQSPTLTNKPLYDNNRANQLRSQVNPVMDRLNIFNANTASDRLNRLTQGQPELYQEQQRQLGNMRPANNIVGATLGNSTRLLNSAFALGSGLSGLGQIGASSVFGNDQDYADTVNRVYAQQQRQLSPTAGIGGTGTFFNSADEAANIGIGDLSKKIVGGAVGTVGELAPIPATRLVRGANLINRAAKVGTVSSGANIAADAGNQLVTTGQIDPRQTAIAAASGFALGAGLPLVPPTTRLVGRGAQSVARGAQVAEQRAFTPRATLKDQQVLRDYSDYLAGAKPFGADTNQLIADARQVGAKHGIDLTNGSLVDRLERSNSVLDQIGAKSREVGSTPVGGPLIPIPKGRKATGRQNQASPKQEVSRGKAPAPSKRSQLIDSKSVSSTTKLNTKRLKLQDEATQRLDKETTDVVERLSNKEVAEIAKNAGMDIKSYGVAKTRTKIAEQLNVRNKIGTIEQRIIDAKAIGAGNDEIAGLMRESAEMGRISRSQGTDLGRQLQARRIIADQLATPQQRIFRLLDEAGVDPDKYAQRLASVDFDNANEVVKAYRDLVPAKFGDWLDKYRYTNMLSSPLTHIVNIASNAQGLLGVAPVQKLYEGGVDAVRSAINGKERTRFASEAGAYVKGAIKSLPEAKQKFADVLSGKQSIDTPDADAIRHGKLAYSGAKGVADTILSVIPKFLEAADQFSMTASRSGERAALQARESKGVKVAGDLEGKVEDAAKYRVFRQDLGKEGQGGFLDAMDWIPLQLLAARRHKNPIVSNISKFIVPFVTTPTNLFKQGIEYSPAGILTLKGNSDKTAQLAKMAMGSTVIALGAGALAAQDGITFSEPVNAKERDAFRAEGKQAYSVKIGDKWVSYSKLHPAIAFNLAVVGAVKDAQDKNAISQDQGDKILQTASSVLGFFRDQSYMKSVGDFTSSLQLKDGGDLTSAFASMGSNVANQLVPFKSLVSWVGRQVDPTQRKTDYTKSAPEQIYQNIVKDIPGLNKNVQARIDPYTGQPVKNDNPILNSFSPVRMTNDKGYGNTTGLNQDQREQIRDLPADQKETFRQKVLEEKVQDKHQNSEKESIKKVSNSGKLSNGKVAGTIGNELVTKDNQSEWDEAKRKYDFKQSGKKSQVIGDTYYFKTKSGTISSEPKYKHDYDVNNSDNDLTLSRAKADEDVNSWLDTAEKQLDNLHRYKQKLDPELDREEINSIAKKEDALTREAIKYHGYGGFTKPKSGKSVAKSAYKLSDILGADQSVNKSLRQLLKEAHL